ncbi:MAG: hypothetical protein AAGF13_07280 [Pseudomonadota bacterium]
MVRLLLIWPRYFYLLCSLMLGLATLIVFFSLGIVVGERKVILREAPPEAVNINALAPSSRYRGLAQEIVIKGHIIDKRPRLLRSGLLQREVLFMWDIVTGEVGAVLIFWPDRRADVLAYLERSASFQDNTWNVAVHGWVNHGSGFTDAVYALARDLDLQVNEDLVMVSPFESGRDVGLQRHMSVIAFVLLGTAAATIFFFVLFLLGKRARNRRRDVLQEGGPGVPEAGKARFRPLEQDCPPGRSSVPLDERRASTDVEADLQPLQRSSPRVDDVIRKAFGPQPRRPHINRRD